MSEEHTHDNVGTKATTTASDVEQQFANNEEEGDDEEETVEIHASRRQMNRANSSPMTKHRSSGSQKHYSKSQDAKKIDDFDAEEREANVRPLLAPPESFEDEDDEDEEDDDHFGMEWAKQNRATTRPSIKASIRNKNSYESNRSFSLSSFFSRSRGPSDIVSESGSNVDGSRVDGESKRTTLQYTVKSVRDEQYKERPNSSLYIPLLMELHSGLELAGNRFITGMFEGSFQMSFVNLIACYMFVYCILCVVFAALFFAHAQIEPSCISDGNGDPVDTFPDMMQLSWTTFSTVGYGNVHSSSYSELGNDGALNCVVIYTLTALQAYLGILYAGFCGAILFAKTLNCQKVANVKFSDPLCVRFGKGVESYSSDLKIPCPVLTFEIINMQHQMQGSAIVNANIKVLVGRDTIIKKEIPENMEFLTPLNEKYEVMDDNSVSEQELFGLRKKLSNGSKHILHKTRNAINLGDFREHAVMGGKMVEHKTCYRDLKLHYSEHPFFQRAWVLTHKLDADSPLLKKYVRDRIRMNKGFWPNHLNTHEKVRDSLKDFDRMIVSLEGVSSISGNEVQRRKIYYFSDILVGYHHAEVVWVSSDGSFHVDFSLINDVREQEGGGGEPII